MAIGAAGIASFIALIALIVVAGVRAKRRSLSWHI
jgi:hypothetical protein